MPLNDWQFLTSAEFLQLRSINNTPMTVYILKNLAGNYLMAGRLKPYYSNLRMQQEPLPGILAFHDHGANKYFGNRKITRTSDLRHPLIVEHQQEYYENLAWANEIARTGICCSGTRCIPVCQPEGDVAGCSGSFKTGS